MEVLLPAPRVGRPALALLVALIALTISAAAHASAPRAPKNHRLTMSARGSLIWTSPVRGTGTWTFTR